MPINEERLRSAINSNTLRNSGNELLAQLEQLAMEMNKAPRDDVMVRAAVESVKSKAYGLIGSYSDLTNPAPLPPPTPEVKPDPSPVAEAEPEVPEPVAAP